MNTPILFNTSAQTVYQVTVDDWIAFFPDEDSAIVVAQRRGYGAYVTRLLRNDDGTFAALVVYRNECP